MRILYFTDTYFPQINGVTNTLERLKKYLDSKKMRYMFFAPYYENTPSGIRDRNVRRFGSISLPAYPECRLSIPFYSRLCRLADRFRPDIVHVMTPAGIGYAGLKYANERGLPVVSSFTTNFDAYLKYYKLDIFNNLVWSFFKRFHNSCHLNFCPSQDTLLTLQDRGIENLKIMSRGIDTSLFNPSRRSDELRKELGGDSSRLFLYTGRLAVEKDLDILVESIKAVNCRFPGQARYVIAGDGPIASRMKQTCPENVHFTGYLRGEGLSALYASCDAFVFPSSSETFGNVVLEAMASGLPVAGVNSGGVKASIVNGYNGFLVAPRDAESFTGAIVRFIEDDALLRRMGHNARQYTLMKSWDRVFNQMVSDYANVIEKCDKNLRSPEKVG